VRIHQIREMQSQVAKDTGVPAFDFGEIWEGWQPFQQMVHPEKVSGATGLLQIKQGRKLIDANASLRSGREDPCTRRR
jgi:hypothetical protein